MYAPHLKARDFCGVAARNRIDSEITTAQRSRRTVPVCAVLKRAKRGRSLTLRLFWRLWYGRFPSCPPREPVASEMRTSSFTPRQTCWGKVRTVDTVGTDSLNTYYDVCGCYTFEKEDGLGTFILGAAAPRISPRSQVCAEKIQSLAANHWLPIQDTPCPPWPPRDASLRFRILLIQPPRATDFTD
jgi:hypothetical protein